VIPATPGGTLAREIRGETLLLHPERALSWPSRRMLVIADTHFGKGSVFARNGIAVPGGTDSLDLRRIHSLLRTTGSERLLVVGDFVHGLVAPDGAVAAELDAWMQALHPVQVWLVTGNHDRSAARGWQPRATWKGAVLHDGPFCFTHDVDERPPPGAADAFRIGGHLHPVVKLGAWTKRRLRLPVFWERPDALVLPAFGLFTGGYRITRQDGGRAFAADAEQVMEVGL
jgi:DNA ligase-associated metallophosphoesterase